MAFTTEVRDDFKEILDFSAATIVDITNAISDTAPILDHGQEILDIDVVIAVEIGIAMLLKSEILLDPLDRGHMVRFARLVVEDDPEWLA